MKTFPDPTQLTTYLVSTSSNNLDGIKANQEEGRDRGLKNSFLFQKGCPQPPNDVNGLRLKQQALASLEKIAVKLNVPTPVGANGLGVGSQPQGIGHDSVNGSVQETDSFDMSSFMLRLMNLCIKVYVGSAENQLKQQKIDSAARARLGVENANKMEKGIKDQEDFQRKWGWLGPLVKFIISLVELVLGALKAIQAAAEGLAGDVVNAALDGAAAAAYLAAGAAGMVSFFADMAEKLGADKKTCEKVKQIADGIQLGCEMAAMLVDLFRMGSLVKGLKALGSQVESALKNVGSEMLQALKSGNMQEFERLIEMVGKEVSKDVMDFVEKESGDLANGILKDLKNSPLGGVFKKFAQEFGEARIKEVITKLIRSEVEKAVAKLVGEVVEEVEKALPKAVVDKLQKNLLWQGFKSCMFDAGHMVFYAGKAGQGVAMGVTGVLKADVSRNVGNLKAEMNWLTMMMMMLANQAKSSQEHQKNDSKKSTDTLRSTSDMCLKAASVSVQVAAAMV